MIKDEKLQTKVIETYTGDMLKAINQNEGGLIQKIIHEQEAHEAEKQNFSPQSKQNRIFTIVGFVLILAALSGIGYVFLKKDDGTVAIAPQFTPLIFTDKTRFLDITGMGKEKIIDSILVASKTAELKPGGIHALYTMRNNRVLGLTDFLKAIQSNLIFGPNDFVNENFLLGISSPQSRFETEVVVDPTKIIAPPPTVIGGNLFILLKIRSFTDIFKTMQDWEKKMFVDMHDFFGIPISTETSYLITKDFENDIIQNKNARVLRDKEANIVMMYVFADDNTIVISNKEETVREIIGRLAGSKVKK